MSNVSVLTNTRVLSLALNLPGPAALMRCRAMGATCVKLEPPASTSASSSDPMAQYAPDAYAAMHDGVLQVRADLKTAEGQATLQAELARADVLITSFRPSALRKLGLEWGTLHVKHPRLSMVAIVGSPAAAPDPDSPGHDLTYLAKHGLVTGLELPPTLYADMAGALMTTEAVLQALLHRALHGEPVRIEVALSEAAHHMALPRHWGLTSTGGAVGGAHAGYRIYPCRDGRVALAALEPHFAARLCELAGLDTATAATPQVMFRSSTHAAVAAFVAALDCDELEALARSHDLPLHAMRS